MKILLFILFLLPGFAVLAAMILINVRGNCTVRIKRSLTLLLGLVALCMFLYAQYHNPYLAARYSWGTDFLYCLLSPFCAPVYFLFLNSLTDIHRKPLANYLAFLPAIIYAVMLITGQLLMNDAERHAYICNEILGKSIQMDSTVPYEWMVLIGRRVYAIFMPLQALIVMIYGEFRLNSYLKLVNDYNSSYRTGNSTRLRGIHVLTVLIAVLCLAISLIPIYEGQDQIWMVGTVVVAQIILVSFIVSYVIQLKFSAMDIQEMIEGPVAPVEPVPVRMRPVLEKVRTEPAAPSPLIDRIDSAMRNESLFLQPDLSLISLCERIGTNRTYASKAIKEAKGCNFSDYVNRYRLDYALEILKSTPKENIIIQNIATQCGCGSIQTFYRYFKLFYNETPTQWIERNK